MGGEKKKGMT